MKFISCYIAGFGKFVDFSFDFSAPITEIKEDNGWGKTTFADFLKCMLYGLDGSRVKSVVGNERTKYKPWKNAVFGGTLTIEYQGKRYRIERTFGKTQSGDTLKIYDENAMPYYEFGDNPQRLGETLFELDGESFRRSVYIPQGEISTGSLPDTMKNRLVALLTQSNETGEKDVIGILEDAERALRSKRKPAKGKLDILDEDLERIYRAKTERQAIAQTAGENRKEIKKTSEMVEKLSIDIRTLQTEIEVADGMEEVRLKKERYYELQSQLQAEKQKLVPIKDFFGEVEPSKIQSNALDEAVADFYQKSKHLQETKTRWQSLKTRLAEKRALKAQLIAEQKTQASYKLFKKQKGRKKEPKEKKNTAWTSSFLVCVAFFGVGIALFQYELLWSLLCIGIGVLAIVGWCLLKSKHSKKDDTKTAIKNLLEETAKNVQRIEAELASYENDLEEKEALLQEEVSEKERELQILEEGLRRFFKNFSFSYDDYRLAWREVKANMEKFAESAAIISALEEKMRLLAWTLEKKVLSKSALQNLKAELADLKEKKEEWVAYLARITAKTEELEQKSDITALDREESSLLQEKERLEKRLTAIKKAKELFMRAKENMAAKYLQPVEEKCAEYLKTIGAGMRSLRYSADGQALFEENGSMRSWEYYSEGEKELVGLCTRIALVECLFEKEKPVLILDDPFVNLDDRKTERAKRLVQELSKTYQILYCTCKTERQIAVTD